MYEYPSILLITVKEFCRKDGKNVILTNNKRCYCMVKDADFFDKEATIKEYFKICPPEKRRKVNNYDELLTNADR